MPDGKHRKGCLSVSGVEPPKSWSTTKPDVWIRSLRSFTLSAAENSVALTLASYANKKDGQSARPGLERLAWASKTSVSTCQRALGKLQLSWLIFCSECGNGRGHAQVWWLTLHDELLDAVTANASPGLLLNSPITTAGGFSFLKLLGESNDASVAATWQLSPGGNINGPLVVGGTAQVTGILTPGAGTSSNGSAPSPAQNLVNGTASQLTDTTRDYMLYLVLSGTGNITLQIGSTSAVGRTIVPTVAAVAGVPYSVRIPAGWFVKWTGTGTVALASQTVVGC
jgi:hypothetical protein